MTDITGKKIALLTTNGVEQVELTSPVAAIREAGGVPSVVSPESDQIQAMQGDWEHSDHFDVDVTLADARAEDFDALVLPGGTLNADTLRINEQAQAFVKGFFEASKPVAAICHGPWILTEIDEVAGRTMTSFTALRTDLINAGASWVDEPAVVSSGLLTSRNPNDLDQFNAKFLELVAAA